MRRTRGEAGTWIAVGADEVLQRGIPLDTLVSRVASAVRPG
jgi:hypothetical protein